MVFGIASRADQHPEEYPVKMKGTATLGGGEDFGNKLFSVEPPKGFEVKKHK